MVFYDESIVKRVKKANLPRQAFLHFDNVFKALDVTRDLGLFDTKRLKDSERHGRIYYRLRKGKYRAIFYLEEGHIYVIALDKREEVYRRWR